MSEKDGWVAFPSLPIDYIGTDGVKRSVDGGMTLRDYFAAKAMAALIVKYPLVATAPSATDGAKVITDEEFDQFQIGIVHGAYLYADAMLKECAK